MTKIMPLLIAVTATAVSSGGTRGEKGGFSKPGLITVSSSIGKPGEISRSKYNPIVVSFPTSSSASSLSSKEMPSSSSTPSSELPQGEDYFYCDRYGPFSEDSPRDTQLTFTYELNSIPSQTILERVRIFKNENVVYASSKPSFNYVNGERKTVTLPFNVRDYIDSHGIELRFEIVNNSYQVLKAYTANLFPPSKERILATSLKHEIYTSRPVAFYGNGSEMVEVKDIFDFTKIGDYVDNDYYYRLDIGRNAFYHQDNNQVACSSANLRFYDGDYLFPNFTHESNDEIVIPLKIYQRNDRLSFLFVNKFYVNRKTLDISDSYQPNYIITSSFYLPINGLNKFNNKTIYIDINELGYDRISTTIPLKYELNRLIMGSCSDGEYCIHGGTN